MLIFFEISYLVRFTWYALILHGDVFDCDYYLSPRICAAKLIANSTDIFTLFMEYEIMFYTDGLSFLVLLVTHYRNFRQEKDNTLVEESRIDDQTTPTENRDSSPLSAVSNTKYGVVTFPRSQTSAVSIQDDVMSSRSGDTDGEDTLSNNDTADLFLRKRTMSMNDNPDEAEIDLRGSFFGMMREHKSRKTEYFEHMPDFGASDRQISESTFNM